MPVGSKKFIPFRPHKFNMESIPDFKKIVFIGKTNTGKSTLVLDYLYHHKDVPIVTVISPTDMYNKTFSPHVPALLIHDEYSSDVIKEIQKRQHNLLINIATIDEYKDVDPRITIVLDDCLADATEWTKDKNIIDMFFNGRHKKMTIILTMQFSIGIPPKLRANFQYVFLCRDNRVVEQKKLYNNYGSMFPSFDMFKQVHDKCTENYGALVINLESTSSKLEDTVFWYKSSPELKPDWGTFQLCYDALWVNNQAIIDQKTNSTVIDDDEPEYNTQKVKFNVIKQHR